MGFARKSVFVIVVFTLVLLGYLYNQTDETLQVNVIKINVTEVVDGDTIKSDGIGSIRLMGINTPERGQPYYNEAKSFLKSLEGEIVDFVDKGEDKYGRRLGYLLFNGKLINQVILENGWANLYFYQEDDYTHNLKIAEEKAKSKNLGIWKRSTEKCGSCFELTGIDNGEEKDDCKAGVEFIQIKNICTEECSIKNWTIKDDANHIFEFPNIIVRDKDSVFLYNGNEKSLGNNFFWGNTGSCLSVLNDDHDSVFFRDADGGLVLFYRY